MSVRHVVLSSFVLLALVRATSVAAGDLPDKPVLGSVEPIGELLIVKAGIEFEDDAQTPPLVPSSLPDFNPTSVPPGLLQVPASITVPEGFGLPGNEMLRATARITPGEEIGFHLSQAVLGLTAAGLNDEAERASSLLKEFQKHQARLVLAAKQAQLNELQAEIDRLKLRVEKGITAEQVMVSIMIVEVDDGDARKLFTDHPRVAPNGELRQQSAPPKTFDKQAFQTLKSLIQENKSVRVLGEPKLVVLSGQQGQVISKGKLSASEIALIGGPKEISFGTSVTATPTITDKDQVRLSMTFESSVRDEEAGVTLNGTFVPGVSRRQFQSRLDLKTGLTTILGGFAARSDEQTTETFIAVTAEIIQPIEGDIPPQALRPIPSPPLK